MAVLSEQDRFEVWADIMRQTQIDLKNDFPVGAITKQQLREVVDVLDDFLETNASAINTAIPQPQRGILNAQQKAAILMYVISKRYLRS